MSMTRRIAAAVWVIGLVTGLLFRPPIAGGQLFQGQFELSDAVHVDEADSKVRTQFERIKGHLAEQEWDEAVEAIRQIMETSGSKVMTVADRRYVSVADYCHRQIAAMPDAALELYRKRVDPLAQRWYDEGIARRDEARLEAVVSQLFCSSWADAALWALGEMSLERGHYGAARGYWEKILPAPPETIPAEPFAAAIEGAQPDERSLAEHWYPRIESAQPAMHRLRHDEYLTDSTAIALVAFWKQHGVAPSRLAYPGTRLDLAQVRAGLVLVSIRELSLTRAKSELEAFKHLHPDAEGTLEGRKVKLADGLASLIEAAAQWPAAKPALDWPTFAGNSDRNGAAPRAIDIGAPAWGEPITLETVAADVTNSKVFSSRRVAENALNLLSYHPLVVGDVVFYCTQSGIFAFNLQSGRPAWPREVSEGRKRGEIPAYSQSEANRLSRGLGVPRFTMTVHDRKLYARMGSQVTSRPVEAPDAPSALVCIDLAGEPKLAWNLRAEDGWAFEGAPVVEGSNLYIGMRKSDVRPQSFVACFDPETDPPRLRWRTMICSAETPGGGQSDEMTHNLLTMHDGVLYYNTNLGAVGAVNARDGRTEWVSVYPRAQRTGSDGQDRRAAHFYRDLNPCIYYRGLLLVAPSDSESIFALDASTGQMVWESHLAEDVVHLLGVGNGNLLASGDHLWWIDAEGGRVLGQWPNESPHGLGRGLLAGDKVYWPTQEYLYVFEQKIERGQGPKMVRAPISLVQGRAAKGGNLIIAGDKLLIASDDKLFALGESAGAAPSIAEDTPKRQPDQPVNPVEKDTDERRR